MTGFATEVVDHVLAHMNDDHTADNLLIAKAYGYPEAATAKMVNLDAEAGHWEVEDPRGTHKLRIAWPGGKISERPEIRREVVAIHTAAKNKIHGTAVPEQLETESTEKPFSVVIRESSWAAHSDSEGADFMANIMRGISPLADYIDLVVQHYILYVELEKAADKLAADPLTAEFDTPELRRVSALERDLAHLLGDNWREQVEAVAATTEYVARIAEISAAGWLPGIVAHHYTRYLGDLSGGQMIAKRMRKQHGFESAGVEFYEFTNLGDLTEFKQHYRSLLDRLGKHLDAAEQERFLAEVAKAYDFNTRVFCDLAQAKAEKQA